MKKREQALKSDVGQLKEQLQELELKHKIERDQIIGKYAKEIETLERKNQSLQYEIRKKEREAALRNESVNKFVNNVNQVDYDTIKKADGHVNNEAYGFKEHENADNEFDRMLNNVDYSKDQIFNDFRRQSNIPKYHSNKLNTNNSSTGFDTHSFIPSNSNQSQETKTVFQHQQTLETEHNQIMNNMRQPEINKIDETEIYKLVKNETIEVNGKVKNGHENDTRNQVGFRVETPRENYNNNRIGGGMIILGTTDPRHVENVSVYGSKHWTPNHTLNMHEETEENISDTKQKRSNINNGNTENLIKYDTRQENLNETSTPNKTSEMHGYRGSQCSETDANKTQKEHLDESLDRKLKIDYSKTSDLELQRDGTDNIKKIENVRRNYENHDTRGEVCNDTNNERGIQYYKRPDTVDNITRNGSLNQTVGNYKDNKEIKYSNQNELNNQQESEKIDRSNNTIKEGIIVNTQGRVNDLHVTNEYLKTVDSSNRVFVFKGKSEDQAPNEYSDQQVKHEFKIPHITTRQQTQTKSRNQDITNILKSTRTQNSDISQQYGAGNQRCATPSTHRSRTPNQSAITTLQQSKMQDWNVELYKKPISNSRNNTSNVPRCDTPRCGTPRPKIFPSGSKPSSPKNGPYRNRCTTPILGRSHTANSGNSWDDGPSSFSQEYKTSDQASTQRPRNSVIGSRERADGFENRDGSLTPRQTRNNEPRWNSSTPVLSRSFSVPNVPPTQNDTFQAQRSLANRSTPLSQNSSNQERKCSTPSSRYENRSHLSERCTTPTIQTPSRSNMHKDTCLEMANYSDFQRSATPRNSGATPRSFTTPKQSPHSSNLQRSYTPSLQRGQTPKVSRENVGPVLNRSNSMSCLPGRRLFNDENDSNINSISTNMKSNANNFSNYYEKQRNNTTNRTVQYNREQQEEINPQRGPIMKPIQPEPTSGSNIVYTPKALNATEIKNQGPKGEYYDQNGRVIGRQQYTINRNTIVNGTNESLNELGNHNIPNYNRFNDKKITPIGHDPSRNLMPSTKNVVAREDGEDNTRTKQHLADGRFKVITQLSFKPSNTIEPRTVNSGRMVLKTTQDGISPRDEIKGAVYQEEAYGNQYGTCGKITLKTTQGGKQLEDCRKGEHMEENHPYGKGSNDVSGWNKHERRNTNNITRWSSENPIRKDNQNCYENTSNTRDQRTSSANVTNRGVNNFVGNVMNTEVCDGINRQMGNVNREGRRYDIGLGVRDDLVENERNNQINTKIENPQSRGENRFDKSILEKTTKNNQNKTNNDNQMATNETIYQNKDNKGLNQYQKSHDESFQNIAYTNNAHGTSNILRTEENKTKGAPNAFTDQKNTNDKAYSNNGKTIEEKLNQFLINETSNISAILNKPKQILLKKKHPNVTKITKNVKFNVQLTKVYEMVGDGQDRVKRKVEENNGDKSKKRKSRKLFNIDDD